MLLLLACTRFAPDPDTGERELEAARWPLLNGDAVELAGADAVLLSLDDGESTRWLAPGDAVSWERPAILELTAWDEGDRVIGRGELLVLGREALWGDLHAHSNLSHDGCEEVDEDCADRGEVAAEDFFALAAGAGLDFAALTDHAEYATYHPDGDPLSEGLDIWEEQQARVQAAAGEGFLPLLGYEWTFSKDRQVDDDGHWRGGHKTVLLSEESACASWRVAAPHLHEPFDKGLGTSGLSLPRDDDLLAGDDATLYELLREAAASCGEQQVLAFAHHPAWSVPQATDFTNGEFDPDPEIEPLVEIASEHGGSECWDLTAEGCDWWPKTDGEHRPEGSVQAALREGFELGFVGGATATTRRPAS